MVARDDARVIGRTAAVLAIVVAVSTACGSGSAALGSGAGASATVSLAPSTAPAATPARGGIGGIVTRLIPNGVVIESEGRPLEVSLASPVEVWKETSVPPSALEVGDRLYITGTPGTPFLARNVWANVAQLDGVIRAIDATGMMVELRPNGGIERIDLSQYAQFGPVGGGAKLTRADLTVGREVALVVYRPPNGGPARATRIWIW